MIAGVLGSVMETLARDGMTMIVVTHEMGFARRVADRIVFMDEGGIVETAPPRGILQRASDPTAPSCFWVNFWRIEGGLAFRAVSRMLVPILPNGVVEMTVFSFATATEIRVRARGEGPRAMPALAGPVGSVSCWCIWRKSHAGRFGWRGWPGQGCDVSSFRRSRLSPICR